VFPLKDNIPTENFPVVTVALIVANAIVYFFFQHGLLGLPSGGEAGGLIGFNWQFHNCWVIGLEAAGSYLWLDESVDRNITFPGSGGPIVISSHSSFETQYLATFAPRIGYSFGNWLPYITGGLAVGNLDFDQHLQNGGYFSGGGVDKTHAGWMLGGGLQYALNSRWSVRAQYQYIDLGSVHFQAPGEPTGAVAFSTDNSASLREHNASFALIFGF